MKKLFIALMFMLYTGLNAQTFDFTCYTQGPYSHTPQDFTIGNFIYNTTLISDEISYGKFTLSEDGSQYRVETNGDVRLHPREGESYSVGDHVILKERNIEEGGLIWIGRIDRRFDIDDNRDGWYIEIIQNTNPGISANVDVSIGTIGKIADPIAGPLEAHIHTPGNVDVTIGGENLSFNTAIIGDEFTMPYEAGRASNNYPSGTLVWSNSNPVYLGTGVGLGVSNGSYFIVKYGDDKYLIIQGYQITGNGRIGVQRIVYNTGVTTDISVFNTFASQENHFTVGRIAAPTITDLDFTHTPGEVGLWDTTTTSEERFTWTGSNTEGRWVINEDGNLQFTSSNTAWSSVYIGNYVVVKQKDAESISDVWIGKVVERLDVPGGSSIVSLEGVHTPNSWTLTIDQPIQLGLISEVSYDHTPGDIYSSDRTLLFDTTTTVADEDRFNQNTLSGVELWDYSVQHPGHVIFFTAPSDLSKYPLHSYVVIKNGDVDAVDDIWIGQVEFSQQLGSIGRVRVNPVYNPLGDVWHDAIQVGAIADPTEVRVNLRVEIAQPYASDYSAVEDVTIRDDADSQDDGSNQRLLFNTQIDINNPRPSHSFEENHLVSWFNDATRIDLWPRNTGDVSNTRAGVTDFIWTPPTAVHEETYTYKYFARDGGYDIANDDLDGLPFHFELDNDIPIQGISLTSAFSINTTLDFILITLNRTSDSNLVNVGDKVLIVYGDFLMEGTVHDKPSNGFIEVRRVRGHAYNGFGVIHTRGVSPKLYKLK